MEGPTAGLTRPDAVCYDGLAAASSEPIGGGLDYDEVAAIEAESILRTLIHMRMPVIAKANPYGTVCPCCLLAEVLAGEAQVFAGEWDREGAVPLEDKVGNMLMYGFLLGASTMMQQPTEVGADLLATGINRVNGHLGTEAILEWCAKQSTLLRLEMMRGARGKDLHDRNRN